MELSNRIERKEHTENKENKEEHLVSKAPIQMDASKFAAPGAVCSNLVFSCSIFAIFAFFAVTPGAFPGNYEIAAVAEESRRVGAL
jgi:hypothetical protein